MTETELRNKIVEQARGWIGLKETDGSFKPIIDRYNAITPLPAGYRMSYTDPWCAAFVSAVGAACGLTDIILPECSCDRMIALYKARGLWQEGDAYAAKPGDLIFYDWDGDRVSDHVGLVVAVEGEYLRVVEGNKSDAVGERRVHMDNACIRGYGQPDYATHATEEATVGAAISRPQTTVQPVGAAISRPQIALPTLSTGDTGETVRAAQLLLIGRGCRCGPCGADGEFGAGTKGGVMSYQRGHALTLDGVIGAETWASLLGVTA